MLENCTLPHNFERESNVGPCFHAACVCQFINIIYNLIQHEKRLRAVCAHSIFIGQLWLRVYGVWHLVKSISKTTKKKKEKLETAKYEGVHLARAPRWNIHTPIEIEIIAFFVNFNDSQFIQYENMKSWHLHQQDLLPSGDEWETVYQLLHECFRIESNLNGWMAINHRSTQFKTAEILNYDQNRCRAQNQNENRFVLKVSRSVVQSNVSPQAINAH